MYVVSIVLFLVCAINAADSNSRDQDLSVVEDKKVRDFETRRKSLGISKLGTEKIKKTVVTKEDFDEEEFKKLATSDMKAKLDSIFAKLRYDTSKYIKLENNIYSSEIYLDFIKLYLKSLAIDSIVRKSWLIARYATNASANKIEKSDFEDYQNLLKELFQKINATKNNIENLKSERSLKLEH
ncbi:hypothetical protein EDEG_00259 [Edhazardia aedis USNM 41457]|uniref:Uncharacterized protein n=1 Tax=Edhazardia aedis (strain USNM 41457) TaxID=1003232 RepID=J9DN51_EDHAE|nr:hypothetical protein EDEG_00259 [Edhazardia aedis USNM 41457]|eukprot:EJW02802.1 hypothetical protein EDEG_00259 [Edhazardia aedis USNM 41457]